MGAATTSAQRYFTRAASGVFLVRDQGPDQAAYYAQGIAEARRLFPHRPLAIYHPEAEQLAKDLALLKVLDGGDRVMTWPSQPEISSQTLTYCCDPKGEAAAWEEQQHQTILAVDLANLRANVDWHRRHIGSSVQLMAMVKALSYGSGIEMVARALAAVPVEALGVAYVDEGVALRQAGIELPILVLNPAPEALEQALAYQLELEVSHWRQWDRLKELAGQREQPIVVHLKLETGMQRLGFVPEDLPALLNALAERGPIRIKGLLSHLAAADKPEEDDFTRKQIGRFEEMAASLSAVLPQKPLWHLCNSYGTARFRDAHFDMVRLGISLYGYSALPEVQEQLRQVSVFSAPIAQVKQLQPGDTVSYGRSFTAKKAMRIGVLSVGYADGLNRRLSNGRLAVYAQGHYLPLVGRVCMDMCMIDLQDSALQAGDRVELFGPHVSPAHWAAQLDTIPYEIFTSIGARVKRIYSF